MRCPGCGASVGVNTELCEYCGRTVVVTSFSNLVGLGIADLHNYRNAYSTSLAQDPDSPVNAALGIIQLKLGLFQEARSSFVKSLAAHPDGAEAHFYAAAATLEGKRPFAAGKLLVVEAEKHLNAAIRLDGRGIFYWFHAFIAYDFFERKFLNHQPGFLRLIELANRAGVSPTDKDTLADILHLESVNLPVTT